jgi:hypothetical protein
MEEEKENKKKRERERKRAHTGEIRGRRSRVGDRQPSGTGWDGGEEKERERGTVGGKGEEKMERRMKSGVGTAGVSGEALGFRVILARRGKRILKIIFSV